MSCWCQGTFLPPQIFPFDVSFRVFFFFSIPFSFCRTPWVHVETWPEIEITGRSISARPGRLISSAEWPLTLGRRCQGNRGHAGGRVANPRYPENLSMTTDPKKKTRSLKSNVTVGTIVLIQLILAITLL